MFLYSSSEDLTPPTLREEPIDNYFLRPTTLDLIDSGGETVDCCTDLSLFDRLEVMAGSIGTVLYFEKSLISVSLALSVTTSCSFYTAISEYSRFMLLAVAYWSLFSSGIVFNLYSEPRSSKFCDRMIVGIGIVSGGSTLTLCIGFVGGSIETWFASNRFESRFYEMSASFDSLLDFKGVFMKGVSNRLMSSSSTSTLALVKRYASSMPLLCCNCSALLSSSKPT